MTTEKGPINPINVIAASAGTGKTYRLSQEYLEGLVAGAEVLDGPGIMATTFTNKAANELVERVRRVLLKEGQWQAAQGVLSGYLGTVNSVCSRLLAEHAIEAGLSPDLTVIAEEKHDTVFAIAVDTIVDRFAEDLHGPATRLQIENWRRDVSAIISQARNNNLSSDSLRQLSELSWNGYKELLETPYEEESADSIDAVLKTAIEAALPTLPAPNDSSEQTKEAVEFLQKVLRHLNTGGVLVWQDWAKLSKLNVSKQSLMLAKPIVDAARAHSRHPRLHEDVRATIMGVFNCAAEAMQHYANFKREHGLIDFVDQELMALELLGKPEVREAFRQKIRILLVDEFQDTSPIQLAIFLEIAQLVDYSVWVGDEKQSIFGFRGSDPELMRQAITRLVDISGGERQRLAKSYRSRPSLVAFTNALFSKSVELKQVTSDDPRIEFVEREEVEGQNDPLHLWWLPGKRQEHSLDCLAPAIKEVLDSPGRWPVVDRETGNLRQIRGSDIAILCKTNANRMKTARALVARGLTVATERDTLLDTPECVLSLAALRAIVDDSDTLAIAEMASLLLPDDQNWLDTWLSRGKEAFEDLLPVLKSLKSSRLRLTDHTPSEVLEIAITSSGILETIMSWGNVRQRLANLDALRGLALTYEEICSSARTAATASGLIVFLDKKIADGGNQPANPDENGIHILTYHKSKGLEWPMVILFDLDQPVRGTPFGITVESSEDGMDPLNPLAGRTIRYWPWPYGLQRNKIRIEEKAGRTKEAVKANRRATSESLRLLYVGMTRARDYLVFACRMTSTNEWLKKLTEPQYEQPILDLPLRNEATVEEIISGVPESRTCISQKFAPDSREISSPGSDIAFVQAVSNEKTVYPSYHLLPSGSTEKDFALIQPASAKVIEFCDRVKLSGAPDMQAVGDCVHAFLSIDDPTIKASSRSKTAQSVLQMFGVENITPEDLVIINDRLHAWINTHYPDAVWMKEMPVAGKWGMRRVRGSIDLLIETPDGYVIFDHKTFPGRPDQWAQKALSFAPQMALYKYLVTCATGKPVVAQFIHMPIVGAMVELECAISVP